MEINIQLTNEPIAEIIPPSKSRLVGAWAEFRGIVRGEEGGQPISALEYEAYPEMAEREIRRLLNELAKLHPCLAVRVIHRLGKVAVGKTAVYVGVAAKHRGPAFAFLADFMSRLKQDVPIWKRRTISVAVSDRPISSGTQNRGVHQAPLHLDEAIAEIHFRCQPLPPVHVALEKAWGRILRETVYAREDLPANDRSARDGYAILQSDPEEHFQVVDTIHAADWKPRQLKPGEAVRVATGASLPGDGLRVVMQEHVERGGKAIHITKRETELNIQKRGEDLKAGQTLLAAGTRLHAGKLALLATAGHIQPLVSPRLRVVHFTTGDEVVAPEQMPQRGQLRDSNSILIRSLLQRWSGDVLQRHLPEDFEQAKSEVTNWGSQIDRADLTLISGGASVGDKDFTRPLLEELGFEIVFSQINLRPGRPLLFGVNGARVAFGLPGNPLSHFVCFHFAVATALARLSGAATPLFLRGRLAQGLIDAVCPRETLWPARLEWNAGSPRLLPLAWASSGTVTSLASANALLRVPANSVTLDTDTELEFLPTTDMLET